MLDKEILKGCLKGKRKFQEALYNKYGGRLLGVCIRYTGNRMEADDIFQEAFIKIFKNIKTFKNLCNHSLYRWMKRIMINTAINYLRDEKKRRTISNIDAVMEYKKEDNPDFFEDVFELVSKEEILLIVQNLPQGYRMVFNLYAIESCTHEEIAGMLNISINTSKTQLFKARKKIVYAIREKMDKQLCIQKIM